jgi:hypothetical protein
VPERLCVDQVANGPDANADLAPASNLPAQQVREAWAATLPGQDVPILGERVEPDPVEDECERRFRHAVR